MCCRYYVAPDDSGEKLDAILKVMERKYPGQYKTGEIFPGDAAPAVIARQDRIVAVPAGFGFPGFETGKLILNARSETASQKKAFADSLRSRRMVLPASGFFEWDRGRTKYLFTLSGSPVLYLCGLYRLVEGALRFVILTRQANESMAETHDRMPVIVGEAEVRPYLVDPDAAAKLIALSAPALTRAAAEGRI